MPLISIPEVTVYKRIQVKVVPRPEVPEAKPWMTNGELMLLKAEHDRRRVLHRTLMVLCLGIAALFGLLEVSLAVFAAAPSEAALAGQADLVARQALRTFAKPGMPLAVSSATAVLEQKLGRSRLQYQVTVTLRLLQPLYVPAHSNGTLEYEQLRIGLATAKAQPRTEDWQLRQFPADLPQLVQRSHFAGEKTRITTTLEARRSGWWWKFPAADRFTLICRRPLQGSTLRSFGNVAVYDELRPDPALAARLDEVRTFLRRRAGVGSATGSIRRERP